MTKKEQERLLELCMFALLPKEIYCHELDNTTKNNFINIIRNNLNDDTHTLKRKIKECWNKPSKIKDNQMSIYDLLEDKNE